MAVVLVVLDIPKIISVCANLALQIVIIVLLITPALFAMKVMYLGTMELSAKNVH